MHTKLRSKINEYGPSSVFLGLKSLENQGITSAALIANYPEQLRRLSETLLSSSELIFPVGENEDPLRVAAEYMLEEMLSFPYAPIKHGIPVTFPARYLIELLREEGHTVWSWDESESEEEYPSTPMFDLIAANDDFYKQALFMNLPEPQGRLIKVEHDDLKKLIIMAPESIKYINPSSIQDDMWDSVLAIAPSLLEFLPGHLNLVDKFIYLIHQDPENANKINEKWIWGKIRENDRLRDEIFNLLKTKSIRSPYYYDPLTDEQFIEAIIDHPYMLDSSKLFKGKSWAVLDSIFNALACNREFTDQIIIAFPQEFIADKFLSGGLSFSLHKKTATKHLEPSLVNILEHLDDRPVHYVKSSPSIRLFIDNIILYSEIKIYINQMAIGGVTPETLIQQFPNELKRIKIELDIGVIENSHISRPDEHPLLLAAEYFLQSIFTPPLLQHNYGIQIAPPIEYLLSRLHELILIDGNDCIEERLALTNHINSSQENIRLALRSGIVDGIEELNDCTDNDVVHIARVNPEALLRLNPKGISGHLWPMLLVRNIRMLDRLPGQFSKLEMLEWYCTSYGGDLSHFGLRNKELIIALLNESPEKMKNILMAHDLGDDYSDSLSNQQFIELALIKGSFYGLKDIERRPYEVIKEITSLAINYGHIVNYMMEHLPLTIVEKLIKDKVISRIHLPDEYKTSFGEILHP